MYSHCKVTNKESAAHREFIESNPRVGGQSIKMAENLAAFLNSPGVLIDNFPDLKGSFSGG